MLERFDGKRIRVTTNGGEVFSGVAASCPSGYGLHEFGVEEECVELDGATVLLSDIKSIEDLESEKPRDIDTEQLNALIGDLYEKPYRIADILPYRVEKDSDGQYFAVERYFRQPGQMERINRKQAEILLKLNCYHDMTVSFDNCETWSLNPEPEQFVNALITLKGNTFLRAIFLKQKAMIDISPGDTYMTVYCHKPEMLDLIQKLTNSEGFFLWEPCEDD